MELPKKNTIEESLRSGGITHLFVDSNGVFCSGQEQCVLTGIFFNELVNPKSSSNQIVISS